MIKNGQQPLSSFYLSQTSEENYKETPLLSYKKLAGNRSIVERLRDYE